MTDPHDISEYERLTSLSEDELMFELGRAIRPRDLSAGQPARGDVVRRARDWMQAEQVRVAALVCNDARIGDFRSGKKNDRFELFLVLCDCLATLYTGLPVATIAALVARLGLNALCA